MTINFATIALYMTAFYKYSAAEISNGIKQKQFSARDVIESALSRLDSVNPSINAVIDTYHGDALANADRIDHCIARDESLGDLAGVPVTIKVDIDYKKDDKSRYRL